ncbi:Sec-independent protein translocase subunit TatA [Klenkia brasiliensis]|uniref:Sec-independent protein translocase protein TatA n=1 Tax=Klenkia brasiliensis TaxID=333142 RepID=A0A1G7PRX1_9ACTN|nr:Sec-independent protein translocase subunit TatA [Klenkia brasiliensis]SDF88379.1 sec-independent protein translocase protein TatA [Klenkia brasiliensis]
MDLGVPEIGLILLAVFVLFGYKKLPDATRSLGRSLRIFKGEMNGMKDDDVRAAAPAPAPSSPEELEAAAAEAEAVALEARARAARARADAERPSITS